MSPAKLFWSVTVCAADTRCLIDNGQQRGDRGSRDADLYNHDGSVDVHFGPGASRGESNWIQTIPGSTGSPTSGFTGRWSPLRPQLEARRHHPVPSP